MAEFDGQSHFHKAALRHLRDARKLLSSAPTGSNESGASKRHLQGAIYLAGYTVECVLKEYIISREPGERTLSGALAARRNRNKPVPDLSGARGHSLASLLDVTDLEAGLDNDPARKQDWGLCLKWKHTWRYAPETRDAAFANDFVDAVERVHRWVAAQL